MRRDSEAQLLRFPSEREPLAQMIEDLANDVRAGKITNVAICGVIETDDDYHVFVGSGSVPGKERITLMLGAANILQRRLLTHIE